MALSLLRTGIITRHLKKQLYQSSRSQGYLVLIPEIGEDGYKNVLLSDNGLPEFNDFTIEKCIATISKQCSDYEHGVQDIEKNADQCKSAFEEIFEPLEKLDSQLELTWGVAKTLYLGNSSLMPTNSYINIHQRAHKARLTKFNSLPIFEAIVKEKNKLKKLSDEEMRLLDKYILEGKLNGVELKGLEQGRLNYILQELSKERNSFKQKVSMSEIAFSHTIEDPNIVKDFPESLLNNMVKNTSPYQGPWKISLLPHVYEPFMQHCPDRDLRWNAWQARMQICASHVNKVLDTSIHLDKVRKLRQEQAAILGYESYMDMSMETKMAGSVENVNNVIETLLENAKPMQEVEVELVQRFAKDLGVDYQLQIWDIPYWQRKQKWSLYNFDEEKIKEYFPLPKIINILFNLCSTLFKIQIIERSNVYTWHKDVKFYDVFDDSSNRPIAGFYLDPYARQNEKIRVYNDAGWHVTIQNKCAVSSANPLSALIFNFQPPEDNKPSLLTFSEVGILFQRFGQALRHLLTKVNYSEVAGNSNVEWDAAEVCAQVMSHWLYDPSTLEALSGHYATEEPVPQEIIQNLKNIRQHMAGYNLCRELYLSKLDIELHSKKTFWREIVKELWPKYNYFPFDKYDSHPLSFTKIISDEWGGAYYCNLWSKMIAADVYSAFEEARQNNQDILAVSQRYKDTFLALGGGCHPSEVFRRFRGRDPSPNAFLNNLGLVKKAVEE